MKGLPMTSETFAPLLTAEIPPPVVDPGISDDRDGPLPRSLAQAAGKTRARRGVLIALAALALQAALEGGLLARLSTPRVLVVYRAGAPGRRAAR